MKLSLKGLTGAATMLAAALGLNLLGPHRAYAAPGTLAQPGDSDLGVTILSPDPHVALTGLKPVEISAFYQGSPGNQIVAVELYLDGAKAATKTLDVPETRGVVSFLVDAAQLSAGTHKVVVRATAADEEVKSAKTVFTYGDTDRGDDRLSGPALNSADGGLALPVPPGQTAGGGTAPTLRLRNPSEDGKVSGTVTLRVDATDPSGKAPYVSLFIDKTFKTLRNFAPYEFEWDTTAYTNGYHEIEVDGYNDGPNIGHSKTLRLLVQNEGGNTSIRHDLLDGAAVGEVKTAPPVLTAPARRVAPVRRTLQTPRVTPRRVSRAPQKSLGRPLPTRRPDALLALVTPSRSAQTRDILREMAHAGGESLHFGALGFGSDLSNPFVGEKAAPTAPTSATPTRGFKPLPATRSADPAPETARLASVPSAAHAGGKTARPVRLASLHLPSADLASPFLVAPHIGPLSQKPEVKIGAYRAEMRTARASLKPALKMHPLRVHFPASLGSLLRSVGQTSVLFDHATVQLDRPIAAQNGIVFGPLRQIFEQGGGTLTWQSRTGTVHAKNARKDIVLSIGQSQAMVNARPVLLDGKPYLMTGRTMVPLSFVSTALDADVQYDAATGHLVITSRK